MSVSSECVHMTSEKSSTVIFINKTMDSSNLCNFCNKKIHKLEKFGVFKIISETNTNFAENFDMENIK